MKSREEKMAKRLGSVIFYIYEHTYTHTHRRLDQGMMMLLSSTIPRWLEATLTCFLL